MKVIVANPHKVKLISASLRKNDRIDAQQLARPRPRSPSRASGGRRPRRSHVCGRKAARLISGHLALTRTVNPDAGHHSNSKGRPSVIPPSWRDDRCAHRPIRWRDSVEITSHKIDYS